jgi:membrane-associated phospholipid phosphatase
VGWLAACAIAGALVRIAAYTGTGERLDLDVLRAVAFDPGSDVHWVMSHLVSFFDLGPFALGVVILLVAGVAGGRLEAAVISIVVICGANLTALVLKHALAAPRPMLREHPLPYDAWPSGHTTAAFSFAIAVVLITPPGYRRPVAAVAAAGVLTTATLLVLLGNHYPSDVLGAFCVGAAWAGVASFACTRSRRATSSASSSSRSLRRRRISSS